MARRGLRVSPTEPRLGEARTDGCVNAVTPIRRNPPGDGRFQPLRKLLHAAHAQSQKMSPGAAVQTRGPPRLSPITRMFRRIVPWNLTGQPAASVPCGFTDEGLPVGLQIIGRRGDDAGVLRVSRALEHAKPWPAGVRV